MVKVLGQGSRFGFKVHVRGGEVNVHGEDSPETTLRIQNGRTRDRPVGSHAHSQSSGFIAAEIYISLSIRRCFPFFCIYYLRRYFDDGYNLCVFSLLAR